MPEFRFHHLERRRLDGSTATHASARATRLQLSPL
jgi:hypothetical protein